MVTYPNISAPIVFGCEGEKITADEKRFFSDVRPFGFILFNRNIKTADQVKRLCNDLRDSLGWQAPILIDQEGGQVQRIFPPMARNWPPILDHVKSAGSKAYNEIYARYAIIAKELVELDIDFNCAPLLDVARSFTHPFLKKRCFAYSPNKVSVLGKAAVAGLRDGGILPVLKHIPGHGLAELDSHVDVPIVSASLNKLKKVDFVPFKEMNDAPMAMTAHVVYEKLDDLPGTISKKVINCIRQDIGFSGVLISDDLSMGGLKGTLEKRTNDILEAGCDLVLHCNGNFKEMLRIAENLKKMRKTSLLKCFSVLDIRKEIKNTKVDFSKLSAQLGV